MRKHLCAIAAKFARSINRDFIPVHRLLSPISNAQYIARKMASGNDVLQVTACKVQDMKNGEMREIEFDNLGKVLLIKDSDKFSAVSHKCTHYGAPLIKGVLSKGRVRCPWHGACFNTKTGDIEDFPGLDSLQSFDVFVQGNDVIVKAQKCALSSPKRQKHMIGRQDDEGHGVVIVGGGAAAQTCAESLRQQSFGGKITILTRESHPPYDRPKLSKSLDVKADSIYLRDKGFYEKYGIEILYEHEVTNVDSSSKSVGLSNGKSVVYDQLLLASGANPRTLPIPGWELGNVHILRTPDDANTIFNKANNKNVVLIGASFIGMEVASSLVGNAASVTVCEFFEAPFQTALGIKVGKVMQSLHEERGIKFFMNASVTELRGEGGVVKQAVLKDGTVIDADIVIAGVGVVPSTTYLKGSGIKTDNRGFVPVDKYLQTNIPNIYAAGDITVFPLKMLNWQPANVQHWQMAHHHGNVVGKNMVVERSTEVNSVPFFWSALAPGKNIRYTGYGMGYDDIVIKGSMEDRKFCAYYCKGDEVVALATFMSDPKASQTAEDWYNGIRIKKSDII
uniref:apoptosis-inducing factor 3-like n=1 Tax=Styela clava TaxID=7725 RepID=UPI00193A247B|nr:apoptosis-inducing factor 3-like [Styela clava]